MPERRLHGARHTAATVLLLLQIPDRTVMAIMGWSNTAMAARYQHIISAIRRDVATSVGGLLWKPAAPAGSGDDDCEFQQSLARNSSAINGVPLAVSRSCAAHLQRDSNGADHGEQLNEFGLISSVSRGCDGRLR
ncbi:MAG: tyrosine-type recombinase/integrase [Pseudonocardiaceae bacterium]